MDQREKCFKCGQTVPWVCFAGNTTLALFKVFVGILSGSRGLIADGLHSASDVLATIMVLISLTIAGKGDDETHPWGHGKIEFAGALLVYVILLSLSIFLFIDAVKAIMHGVTTPPHLISFLAAVVSIVANFILSGYGFCAGKQLNSPAMIANANENKADMLSSFAVVVGIIGANMGFLVMDSIAAVLVALIIFRTALTLGIQAFQNLIDVSLPGEKVGLIHKELAKFPRIKGTRYAKTRRVGQSVWVELEIYVDPRARIEEAGVLVREVRLALMRRFEHIKEVSITFSCREVPVLKKRRRLFFQKEKQAVQAV
ncbi:MAG: cation transporter [Candidatus Omnitrophica bacterium]|nr:cation transporter [Candidatus Omnitrophota bacterium]